MDTSSITAVGLTMAITQMLKMMNIPTRILPILILAVGIGASCGLAQGYDTPTIIQGVVAGLIAMGLWTGSKVVVKGQA